MVLREVLEILLVGIGRAGLAPLLEAVFRSEKGCFRAGPKMARIAPVMEYYGDIRRITFELQRMFDCTPPLAARLGGVIRIQLPEHD
jgi:hypothetical protein